MGPRDKPEDDILNMRSQSPASVADQEVDCAPMAYFSGAGAERAPNRSSILKR
jgi:hypothetical protein